jgi:hypothetical protein
LDAAGKLITLRPDRGCGVAIDGPGIKQVISSVGRIDPIVRGLLEQMK